MTPQPNHQRAILTLATGPAIYWNMAVNLARSIRRWHTPEDLPVVIATDYEGPLPPDLKGVSILKLKPGEIGKGFETKLRMDLLAPAQRTLFIDADCLVYASLDAIFKRLENHPVATIGSKINTGEWFGDVAEFCQMLGVDSIPQFNGGLYYFEKNGVSARVFQRARDMVQSYDQLKRVRLRGLPNDELLMSAAMALEGLSAVPDDGTVMSDPQSCPGPMQVNILRGERLLRNPPTPAPLHRAWYPFQEVRPVIVHYLGHFVRGYDYRAEAQRLRLTAAGWPAALANATSALTVMVPGLLKQNLKNCFRPLVHKLFGARKIRTAVR